MKNGKNKNSFLNAAIATAASLALIAGAAHAESIIKNSDPSAALPWLTQQHAAATQMDVLPINTYPVPQTKQIEVPEAYNLTAVWDEVWQGYLSNTVASAGSQERVMAALTEAREVAHAGVAVVASAEMAQPQTIQKSESAQDEFFIANAEVTDGELDQTRGTGTSFTAETLGVAVLEAIAVNNQTNGAITGSNLITNDVFGNAKGVVSLIQNTGNNVIIQSATVVNLSLQ